MGQLQCLYGGVRSLPYRPGGQAVILAGKGDLSGKFRGKELAFGVLKNDYDFQRFLLRGKTKVKLEILLLCMGYNLNKLHAKIQNGRTGSHLFEIKEAA